VRGEIFLTLRRTGGNFADDTCLKSSRRVRDALSVCAPTAASAFARDRDMTPARMLVSKEVLLTIERRRGELFNTYVCIDVDAVARPIRL
jgi:hypothetical protein